MPILRGERGEVSGGRNRGDDGKPKLHPIPAAGAGAGGDAVEFSVLASIAIRGAGVDGRERGASEACLDRSAKRAGDRGRLPEGRVPRRSIPDAAGGFAKSGQNPGRSAGHGGHADGKRRSGNRSGNRRGEKNQESGAGTGRKR